MSRGLRILAALNLLEIHPQSGDHNGNRDQRKSQTVTAIVPLFQGVFAGFIILGGGHQPWLNILLHARNVDTMNSNPGFGERVSGLYKIESRLADLHAGPFRFAQDLVRPVYSRGKLRQMVLDAVSGNKAGIAFSMALSAD